DLRAFDGTVTIQQPLVEPLYNGKSAHELLSILLGKPDQNSHEIVKGYWQSQIKGDFERAWKTSLHDGWIAGRGSATLNGRVAALPALPAQTLSGTEIVFRPDPTIGDGSWANNGWLQECPKPQSKMTWDNVVAVSPKNAGKLGVDKGDMLRVTVNGRQVVGPTWVLPGHAKSEERR